MRYTKPTGHSRTVSRLRKVEGWNDKRFATTPVVHDSDDELPECECADPKDNDRGVCMGCGWAIAAPQA